MKRRELLRGFPIVARHAFDTESKMMATVHEHGRAYFYAVKGAPEHVLAACPGILTESGEIPLDEAARHLWSGRIAELGQHGLRVLACATKLEASATTPPYHSLIFVGPIGLEDPARADVPRAIRDCHNAGIRVVMVTGDHAVTAHSIGRAIGLELTR